MDWTEKLKKSLDKSRLGELRYGKYRAKSVFDHASVVLYFHTSIVYLIFY
jgi:hypothetical protein